MLKKRLFLPLILIGIFFTGFAGGLVVGKRGVPFVAQKEQWTIGIFRGSSPFSFNSFWNWFNPLLKAEDVTDISAKFVADPFLIKEGKIWYLFFEVYNNQSKQGDLALATSTNTWFWDYRQVILDEPFHLSYPYVFKWENDYYLIPESFEANSIRLYKAEDFPIHWSYQTSLLEGRNYVDNSIVHFNGKWWLFASVTTCDTLYLFYADNLTGPWIEHPASPIVAGNLHKARPSGRVLIYQDKLYRYTMDVDPPIGTHLIMAYEITELTEASYSEKLVQKEPVLKPSGSGWNGQAMHQIDPFQLKPDRWIAAVDGFGKYRIYGLAY
jgi:hypothetical protein